MYCYYYKCVCASSSSSCRHTECFHLSTHVLAGRSNDSRAVGAWCIVTYYVLVCPILKRFKHLQVNHSDSAPVTSFSEGVTDAMCLWVWSRFFHSIIRMSTGLGFAGCTMCRKLLLDFRHCCVGTCPYRGWLDLFCYFLTVAWIWVCCQSFWLLVVDCSNDVEGYTKRLAGHTHIIIGNAGKCSPFLVCFCVSIFS